VILGIALAVLAVIEFATGNPTLGAASAVLAAILGLRVFGVIPHGGLGNRGLDVCARCRRRDLGPPDESGVRHCWSCGADVTATKVTDGS
jgi:hypothetical protein